MEKRVKGNLVDLHNKNIYPAEIIIENGKIKDILSISEKQENFLLPGFIDAHVHIESSMLVPSEFARLAVMHGTVATISDPHEIANVMGIEGVEYMIENGNKSLFISFSEHPPVFRQPLLKPQGRKLMQVELNNSLKKEISFTWQK
jgi:adenine deaminase